VDDEIFEFRTEAGGVPPFIVPDREKTVVDRMDSTLVSARLMSMRTDPVV